MDICFNVFQCLIKSFFFQVFQMAFCCQCMSSIVLSIITLLTMGVISALFVAALVVTKMKDLDHLSDEVFYVIIAGSVISLVLFFFGIYASCCGGRCSKIILAILYLVFAAALGASGAFLIARGDEIIEHCRKIWDDSQFVEVRDNIEEIFKCCGYDAEARCLITLELQTCHEVIGDYISKYKFYGGIAALALAVIVIIGMMIALANTCCGRERSEIIAYTTLI
ncbi:hypothetical protein TRFO_06184 [Tritrichomonas foetus]|uniref:Tetraspanin family protein n=1 Tax=Tritrichomonas foetus TaxID=1144522 RepID=A0A1J4K4Z3_9EUKA|nr:hypothetical protein TRFO_06184 [Tritrichomonas foetus]|eukprot:OHT04750.1 hypothetical protein TRFO_06184 [Tritrichomonas foetus]